MYVALEHGDPKEARSVSMFYESAGDVNKGIQIRQGHQTHGGASILRHHSQLDLPNAEHQEPSRTAVEDDAFRGRVLMVSSQTLRKISTIYLPMEAVTKLKGDLCGRNQAFNLPLGEQMTKPFFWGELLLHALFLSPNCHWHGSW